MSFLKEAADGLVGGRKHVENGSRKAALTLVYYKPAWHDPP